MNESAKKRTRLPAVRLPARSAHSRRRTRHGEKLSSIVPVVSQYPISGRDRLWHFLFQSVRGGFWRCRAGEKVTRSHEATKKHRILRGFVASCENATNYVSETGEVVASYEYDAFGRTLAQSGPMADVFPFRFSTKYYDSETGLYYYGRRYYSPELGRWITRDPIGEDGGVNLYAFCGNNGVGRIDALGTDVLPTRAPDETSSEPITVKFLFDAWYTDGVGVPTKLKNNPANYRIHSKGRKIKLIYRMFPYIGYPPNVAPPVLPSVTKLSEIPMIGSIGNFPLPNNTDLPADKLFGEPREVGRIKTATGIYPILKYDHARFSIGREVTKWEHTGANCRTGTTPVTLKWAELFTEWELMWRSTAGSDGTLEIPDLCCGDVVSVKMGNTRHYEFKSKIWILR